ncbi:general stress protein [Microbacterium sp. gxy059]|uniref:general stress protein n=1 Tax=Microbacterium sp. gxy059 TaxID=2957199 RepID=UPI003D99F3B1
MSMMNGLAPAPQVGETVATYTTYEGAQKAVSTLIEKGVPARDIAIVGSGLRSVEKVTGRLGWAQAAWQGALNGVLIGLLFAAVAVIWAPGAGMAVLGGAILIGVSFGMLMRVVTYAMIRRRRDFASVMSVTAERYEVAVERAHVAEARAALGTTRPRTTVAAPRPTEPPRYGIRVSPGRAPEPRADEPETPPAPPEAPTPQDVGEEPPEGPDPSGQRD